MAPLPLDGYVRVSQVKGRKGERFHSPPAQRAAIKAWAKANGVRIGAWHEDLDRSGGTMDRPGLNAALQRIERGVSGGIVVARLDRFARTAARGVLTIEELHNRGARVVSVAESIDPATAIGRAMLGITLVMAQWVRDTAAEQIATAQERAASAGRFPGRAPFGYVKTDDGLTAVHEPTAEVVRRIFRERAAGVGWRKIADELVADGVPTPLGRGRWAISTVNGIVRSEAPLGVFRGPRGLRIEDAWPAIIDRELWNRANAVRGVRDNDRRHRDRLFAGIARCAGCRKVLTRAVNPEGYVSYGCPTRGCAGRASVGADLLDSHVAAIVDERLARLPLEARPADDGGEAARLLAARDKTSRELEDWIGDLELRDALGDRDWRTGMLARARARDDAETALAELRARGGLPTVDELPAGVTPTLDALPWDVRRRVVEAFLHSVWVRRSALRGPQARQHVASRIRVVWADDRDRPALPNRNAAEHGPLHW